MLQIPVYVSSISHVNAANTRLRVTCTNAWTSLCSAMRTDQVQTLSPNACTCRCRVWDPSAAIVWSHKLDPDWRPPTAPLLFKDYTGWAETGGDSKPQQVWHFYTHVLVMEVTLPLSLFCCRKRSAINPICHKALINCLLCVSCMSRSLLQRRVECGVAMPMLVTQYRMPEQVLE
jgi:hypothetical protein